MNTPSRTADDSPRPERRRTDDLIERLRKVVDQLGAEDSPRGDLKLLTRSLRELRYALKTFAPFRRRRKVTVFGSARTPHSAAAYQHAVQFGQLIVQHAWMVITGAAQGIMEAGHVGAGREHSMGLNILLPFEQQANPVIRDDTKLVHMKYFFTRKLMFVRECDAIVCFPGGFGTLDETFEVMTLLQTGKSDLMPLVLVDEPGGNYWTAFQSFIDQQLLRTGMISPSDLSLYRITERVEDAVDELNTFYRIYHSMRYVREDLVLRLTQELPLAKREAIQAEFADLATDGLLRFRDALPAEQNEPELLSFPRLVFRFHRSNFGRLRQLIDRLNES